MDKENRSIFSIFCHLRGCTRILLLIDFLLLPYLLSAQVNREVCKWIPVQESAFILDSLSIIPASLQIRSPNNKLRIEYDINTNQAKLLGDLVGDSVEVCYRVFPFNLSANQFKRDPQLYKDSLESYADENFITTNPYGEVREEFFDLKGIQKNGNITRGISFGNQQNVFVNSALNLQLDGQLTDDITILASISDQNVPFQPEGNTLQLQEFDKVFVKLSHRLGSLTAGDVLLRNREGYFARFYKNVQGAEIEANYQLNEKSKAKTTLGVAISKGKFASIQVDAIESVQGPYRLVGPNGERFIIVLANSEKVFIDGKELLRGFNNDYVIDYNLAEITFNNNILITQFTRIRVDFEYSERNYNRTIVAASHYQQINKLDFFVNFYQAADNPRNPLIDLSDQNIDELSQAGDGVGFINGVDSLGFAENQIQYKKIDSLSNTSGVLYPEVYVYSTHPDSALFQVSFSQVGAGQGDYVRVNSTVNGQVYQWIEPLNGVSQGDYAPIRVVPTPTKQQLITAGVNYRFSKNERIYAEAAISEQDLNRFSTLNSNDDQGAALKIGYANAGKKLAVLKNYEWFGNIDYELDSRFFRPIDRFRGIEFDRDWSARSDTSEVEDHIFQASAGIRKDSDNLLAYRFAYRNRGEEIQGWQQQVDFAQEIGKIALKSSTFLLRSNQGSLRSEWNRFQAQIQYNLTAIQLGYRYSLDKNKIFLQSNDSVSASAMNYDEHLFFLQSGDSLKVRFRADYSLRYDNAPFEGQLRRALEAQTASFTLEANPGKFQRIALLMTYRRTENPTLLQAATEENILGRLDWSGFFFDKHIQSELTYSTATGRELRKEFVFLQVQTGEGTHTWRDLNQDGVQDLNEFFVAINPDEREYIKIFTPTDEYINAFTNNLVYRLTWKAPINWRKLGGFKGLLSKFSSVSSWTIQKRFTDGAIKNRLLPFLEIEDENLLSTRDALRSTLFYNQFSSKYGLELTYIDNRQKQLLTNGFEEISRNQLRFTVRSNLNKTINLTLNGSQESQANRSDFLLTRNYTIRSYAISPELAFQPNNEFRVTGIYRLALKENMLASENPENARINQYSIELRWNKISKRNLLASIRLLDIRYEGDITAPISYDILEALQPGINWTWSLNWQQRLANGLQLSVTYDGRKSEDAPVFNLFRMQLTALF
ncbi:MAG: hypothetical protein NW226_09360 [Microscillaceae bacterium]|nr:hypothetical protein [Microscillaceae bacterium]